MKPNKFNGIEDTKIDVLLEIFSAKHKFCVPLINRAVDSFGQVWIQDFDAMLNSLFKDKETLESAASGYSSFAMNSMRHQKAFERDLTYPSKTYAEAADEVYHNIDYMMSEYLPGLLLSHFLWQHHYRQLQFFDNAFILPMSISQQPAFVEIGIGTTLYSRRVLDRIPGASGIGYDISESSCIFGQRHIASIGASERYEIKLEDIFSTRVTSQSWLICVEVLEHLEDPVVFLKRLHEILKAGGRGFITAAINSGHADHIYLYKDAHSVQNQIVEAGFHVEQGFMAKAFISPKKGIPVPEVAAFVVKK